MGLGTQLPHDINCHMYFYYLVNPTSRSDRKVWNRNPLLLLTVATMYCETLHIIYTLKTTYRVLVFILGIHITAFLTREKQVYGKEINGSLAGNNDLLEILPFENANKDLQVESQPKQVRGV